MNAQSTQKKYAKGEEIYAAGDEVRSLLKVCSGAVILFQLLSDGRRQIIDFIAPGEMLHFELDGAHDHFAEALTDAEIAAFSPAEIMNDKDSAEFLFEQMRARMQRERAHITMLGRKSAAEKLAEFLLLASERYAGPLGEIDLPLTRQQLADFTGLTLETVSRLFSKWTREKRLVKVGARGIRIEGELAA